jgi:Rab GDP dissociation inhibitor
VDGTFVYQVSKGGMFSSPKAVIHKVPANDSEALSSKLMGLWEKKRCRNFFIYVQEYDRTNPKTFKDFDPLKQTFQELITKFSLEPNTVDFLGHAVSLYIEDSFMSQPAINTINRIKLYMDSIGIYGNTPFLYPIYGLGGIPEGFSRLCAIHGGTYMLNKGVDEFLFDADGKINGVRSGDEVAKAKVVIADPSYLLNTTHVKKVGRVIRCINIMDHPIPNTKDVTSCQIIIPQKQVNRKYDIFITLVSASHLVCPKGLYIAMISTTVETETPELEIQPALELIGQPLEQFITISDLYEPTGTGSDNNLYVTKSYDATSHFEEAADEVLAIYEKITGEKLDLTVVPDKEEDDQ